MEQVRYDDPSKGIRAPYTITSRPLKYVSPNTVARDVLYALGKHDVLDHFSIGPRGVKRKRASSHENHSITSTVGDPSQDNMVILSGRSRKINLHSDLRHFKDTTLHFNRSGYPRCISYDGVKVCIIASG